MKTSTTADTDDKSDNEPTFPTTDDELDKELADPFDAATELLNLKLLQSITGNLEI